ncbi:ArsR/SmtB family transcription factor [Deinococcus pimensis]|uniref:ArsR/SmtB family transcription factor n=1 Tax=Deinococcus pimensis TaxID=309888 RepID=UPI0004B4B02D|nr:metalloregulator ArsR/SmtB family transcription factor [Deinococcus pimensis]
MTADLPLDQFKALADPTRLRVLAFLLKVEQDFRRDGTCFGGSISAHLGLSQPTVSHHMRALVDAGLVRATKEGTTVYYDLDPAGFERVERALAPFLAVSRTPREDQP